MDLTLTTMFSFFFFTVHTQTGLVPDTQNYPWAVAYFSSCIVLRWS